MSAEFPRRSSWGLGRPVGRLVCSSLPSRNRALAGAGGHGVDGDVPAAQLPREDQLSASTLPCRRCRQRIRGRPGPPRRWKGDERARAADLPRGLLGDEEGPAAEPARRHGRRRRRPRTRTPVVANSAVTRCSLATSAWTAIALLPAEVTVLTAAPASSRLAAQQPIRTANWSAASLRAVSRPISREPPVTTATRGRSVGVRRWCGGPRIPGQT